MSNKGWIRLHRNIRTHWLYQEKREFSRFEAWADLLMEANHKDGKFLLGNDLIDCKRGQLITSEVKLSDKWDWGRKKVRNFLQLLENDEMIIKTTVPNKCTIIEIVNYNDYQGGTTEDIPQGVDNTDVERNEEQQKEQQGNNRGTSEEQGENNQGTTEEQEGNQQNGTTEDIPQDIGNTGLEEIKELERNNGGTRQGQPRNNRGTTEEQLGNTNKNVKNVNNEKNSLCMYDENLEKITNIYSDNIGPVLPVIGEQLKAISEEVPADLFKEAVLISVDRNKRYINYIEGILRNWKDAKINTLSDLEISRREKQLERESNQQQYQIKKYPYIKPANKTRFHNFEQRSDKYTDDQLEDVVARKRREHVEKMNKGKVAL